MLTSPPSKKGEKEKEKKEGISVMVVKCQIFAQFTKQMAAVPWALAIKITQHPPPKGYSTMSLKKTSAGKTLSPDRFCLHHIHYTASSFFKKKSINKGAISLDDSAFGCPTSSVPRL